MSQIDNIIIQVRARLHLLGIKLWLEPYYYDEVGCVEEEIEVSAKGLMGVHTFCLQTFLFFFIELG